MKRALVAAAALSGTLCWSGVSWAQADGGEQAARGGGLDDIIVTARRKEERVQSVPVSITAISSESLARLRIEQPDKLQDIVPNLASTPMPSVLGGSVTFIRGVGASELLLSVDSPIATYVDGVYLGRNVSANMGVISPARAEVLRGPQGTLFGRNTTGGAVSLTTPTPSHDLALEVKGGAASRSEWFGQFRLDSGEIASTGLSMIVAYQHRQRHGFVDNPLAAGNRDPGALNSDAVFAKVHGDWNGVTLDYTFDYAKLLGMPLAFQIGSASPLFLNYYGNSVALGGAALPISKTRLGTLPQKVLNRQSVINWGQALTLEVPLSDAISAKSISAYRDYKGIQPNPYAPPGILGVTTKGVAEVYPFQSENSTTRTQHQFSQELQLLGKVGDIDFVAGAFWFKEKGEEFAPTTFTFLIPGATPAATVGLNTGSATAYRISARSLAAFGQFSYKPGFAADKLELVLGGRYTSDRKGIDQTRASVRSEVQTYHNVSYNASVAYELQPDMLLFGRVGTGYRSGGFNARAGAGVGFVFLPEKVTSYEIGFKGDWLDHDLRTNLAVFHTDYRNLQVTQYTGSSDGGSGFTRNADATLKGFELEVNATPLHGLRLDGSVGYVKARYKTIFFPDPVTKVLTNFASISHFPYVPAWTAHGAIQYTFAPIGGVVPSIRADYSWRSRRYFHTNNLANLNPFNDDISQGAYGLAGGSLVLSDIIIGGVKSEVTLWAENLFNKAYRIQGVDFGSLGFAGNVYAMPRRVGVDFRVTF